MKRIITRLATATALAGLSVSMVASPSHAGSDGTVRVLAAVGSDTTTKALDGLAEAYNSSSVYNPDGDKIINVPPLHSVGGDLEAAEAGNEALAWLKAARNAWPGGEVVEADGDCAKQRIYGGEGQFDLNGDGDVTDLGDARFTERNVDTDGNGSDDLTVQIGAVAPNGSSSGRSFALDTTNNPLGCVDLVRSSSAPSAGAQRSNFDTWAFALDAIGWVYFKGNTHGVLNLTQAQLGNVYTCATTSVDANSDGDFLDVGDKLAGKPKLRFWGDLSGNTADTKPIKAYRIQLGSGTGEDVAKTLYGLAGASSIGSGCSDPAEYPVVQEHDCRNVATVDLKDAICAYGYSRFVIQTKALELNKTNGSRFGGFATGTNTPLLPSAATVKEEPTGRYEGTRLVYNLITMNTDGAGQDLPGFADLIRFTGVKPDPDGAGAQVAQPGFICANAAATIIKTWGLIPLKRATTDTADATYGLSTCRHNKYSL